MRILGIDYGTKRIGLALSDELGITAQGKGFIESGGLEPDIGQLKDIVDKNKVDKVVIGQPLNMNGTVGPAAERVAEFAQKLEKGLNIPVITWDERLSTRQANSVLIQADLSRKKRKTKIDQVAAVIMLQSYLDSTK